jgi:thioredoxin reductase (NADPH)
MNSLIWIYIIPLALIWAWYIARRRRTESRSIATRAEADEAGLIEPVSLHPVIDVSRCLGCGACIAACPEQPEHQVLGLIGGKAQLVSPTDCIGHGACKSACPTEAISLVFGTEQRGVTIPILSPDFETSLRGIYVAGELGGMGLIRNALTQGRQAIEALHARGRTGQCLLDVVIVGAGPAGFAAALTATALKMRFVIIEQESLGGCVFQYPRGKVVMNAPAELPLIGKVSCCSSGNEQRLRPA